MPFIAFVFSLAVAIMGAIAAVLYAQDEETQSARAGVVGSSIRVVVNSTARYVKEEQTPTNCKPVQMGDLALPAWFRADDRIKVLHCKDYSFVYVLAKD